MSVHQSAPTPIGSSTGFAYETDKTSSLAARDKKRINISRENAEWERKKKEPVPLPRALAVVSGS